MAKKRCLPSLATWSAFGPGTACPDYVRGRRINGFSYHGSPNGNYAIDPSCPRGRVAGYVARFENVRGRSKYAGLHRERTQAQAAGVREAPRRIAAVLQPEGLCDARRVSPSEASMKPLRPTASLPSDDGFAYHGTNEERACDIVRGGLKTHGPSYGTDQSTWPDGSREKRSYHSKRAGVVASFVPEDGAPVILRTPLSAHPFQTESTGDLYTKKTIAPTKLEIGLDDGTWAALPTWGKKSCG